MTKQEYTEEAISINAIVLDRLITIVGNAMPHTVPQLSELLTGWSVAIQNLDAEYQAAKDAAQEPVAHVIDFDNEQGESIINCALPAGTPLFRA